MPSVSCVKSLLPMEKKEKYFEKSDASKIFDGISAITPISALILSDFIIFIVFLASSIVRQNGIIIFILFSPLSMHFFIAFNSKRKAASYSGDIYLDAPRQPIIGFSSSGSNFSPPFRFLYSLLLKSLNLTITALG